MENTHTATFRCWPYLPFLLPCASPAFIVPKSNLNVLPHWVNDFCQLNENTITDSHPLPRINDKLDDCAKVKIWGTIDMTKSFFQMRMQIMST